MAVEAERQTPLEDRRFHRGMVALRRTPVVLERLVRTALAALQKPVELPSRRLAEATVVAGVLLVRRVRVRTSAKRIPAQATPITKNALVHLGAAPGPPLPETQTSLGW